MARQRPFHSAFPTTSENSFVKNIYYNIGADFTRSYAKTEDAQHKDNLFQYGYVGEFDVLTNRAYTQELEYDSVSGKYAHIQNGFRDTMVVYTPGQYNPESANWTSQYYSFFEDPYQTLQQP